MNQLHSFARELIQLPIRVKLWVLAAIVYAILPTDFVPDFLPLVGILDDLAAILAVVLFVLRTMKERKDQKRETSRR